MLIDTAHDKPQAPEGPTYHIENKGEPSLRLLVLDRRASTDADFERRGALIMLCSLLGRTPTMM